MTEPLRTPEGYTFLNLGCGSVYFPEWNNSDLLPGRNVYAHDLSNPLPWPEDTFDAVYSSHILEHLTPEAGQNLIAEKYRVLKPGGTCRVVVPDLEGICRQYLSKLELVVKNQNQINTRQYRFSVIELLDQMVRDSTGGQLAKALKTGDLDKDQAEGRFGDSYRNLEGRPVTLNNSRSDAQSGKTSNSNEGWETSFKRRIAKWKLKFVSGGGKDPRKSGEVHRWMYDRVSLVQLLELVGFSRCVVMTFDQSSIPNWDKYNLDVSRHGPFPRKPDSLFVEAIKP